MGKRGPQPQFTKQLTIELGKSIDSKWQEEADSLELPKSLVGRMAVDGYFTMSNSYIVLPTLMMDEETIRSTIQLSTEQMGLVVNRAKELQTSLKKIGSIAIAYRYLDSPLRSVELLLPK